MLMEIPRVDLAKEMDIEIVFSKADGSIIGSVEFVASGEELMAKTQEVALNKTYILPDDSEITFTRYTTNVLGQRIYYVSSTEKCNYVIDLVGEDNLGNNVEFELRFFDGGEGRLHVSTIHNGYIDEDASVLTLVPYATKIPEESGEMDGEKMLLNSTDSADKDELIIIIP